MINVLTTQRRPMNTKSAKSKAVVCQFLAKRDGWYCHWCGRAISRNRNPNEDLFATIEHLTRLAEGGTNDESNLVLACRKCNNTRHTDQFNPRVATPLEEALLLVQELPALARIDYFRDLYDM